MDQPPWSKAHPCCIDCGITERPHGALGLCDRCYSRFHYKRNPEPHKALGRQQYHADPERSQAIAEAWRKKNPERNRQNIRDYRHRHKDEINAWDRARYHRKKEQAAGMAGGGTE